jgi:Leucine-rich repeat (LRR) protein
VTEGVFIEAGDYGPRAVLTGRWSVEIERHLLANSIAEIELNDGKGWRGDTLEFLSAFPGLSAFKIIDLTIGSVAPVHVLHGLRSLEVTTYCKTKLEFSAFPHLLDCTLEWRRGSTSLFQCRSLKSLFVNRYDGRDLAAFGPLTSLESLAILNAPIVTLEGLSELKGLRRLRLANLKRLKSLAGLERLSALEEIDIDTCPRIDSIEQLSGLSQLRKLYLNNLGELGTLSPLSGLRGLEEVLFVESTNIVDGDLSPLKRQPKLARISFRNRKHYSDRREDFGVTYSN